MTDAEKRKKVIRGLEAHCKTWQKDGMAECLTNPDMCPYHQGMPGCTGVLAADALALLKEQDESVAPIESTTEQKKFADRIGFAVSEFWCGACRFNLVGRTKFCPNCGKKVKWDG